MYIRLKNENKSLIHKIAGCISTWVGCGYNPEKERVQRLNIRPRHRVVADQRRVPVLVKQEHRNAVHHFLLFQRGVQIKRLVHVALNQVHIGRQLQGCHAGVLRNLLARPAPRRRQLQDGVVRRLG